MKAHLVGLWGLVHYTGLIMYQEGLVADDYKPPFHGEYSSSLSYNNTNYTGILNMILGGHYVTFFTFTL